MKLVLQIALGVFLGTLISQFAIDGWQTRKEGIAKKAEEKLRAEQERVRLEQSERIRALLMQGRQGHTPKLPTDFVPDDVKVEALKEK